MEPQLFDAYDTTRSFEGKAFRAACYAPFVSMELDPRGQVFACCVNQLYPIGKVPESSLREIWEGRRAENLRTSLRAYDLGSGCNVCRWHLEHGSTEPVARSYEGWDVAEPLPAWPTRMTFALSNRCNLACVMCNGELSSSIRVNQGLPALPKVYDDAFFEQLAEFLPHLEYAAFLGGEPFLISENRRVWDLMDELGLSFPITITTNGTQWNDRVRAVIDRFPTSFNLSIDALDPDVLRRIRLNVDPDVVLANAERFAQHAADHGTTFGFMFCLMSENWHQLGPMLQRAEEWDAQIQVISVSEPGLSLHDLPTPELREILRALEAEEPSLDLGGHRTTWDTELEQIRRTIDERGAETTVTIRQAAPIEPGALLASGRAPQPVAVTLKGRLRSLLSSEPEGVSAAVSRLRRWSPDGEVDVLHLDADGRVQRAELGARALADSPEGCVGRPFAELVAQYTQATGADLWVIDQHDDGQVLDQTLILSAEQPLRGAHGTVVRTASIQGAGRDGTTTVLALAVDPYYEGQPAGAPG
jgi:MoaA/NifB/PqqE/SkfB family radical SAM enzyme